MWSQHVTSSAPNLALESAISAKPERLPLVYSAFYDIEEWRMDHRFAMPKFRLLYERLRDTGLLIPGQLHVPDPVTENDIAQIHDQDYVRQFFSNTVDSKLWRRIGLPWSPELARRTKVAIGGTLHAAMLALEYGVACNLAGGTHHAFAERGAGYCIFNDLAVAATKLLNSGTVSKILICDLDVHQGDATAKIFADEKRVFTFSMHCEQNFPRIKQQSDLDIGLNIGTAGDEYLETLQRNLPQLLDGFAPDLVFFDAGVDPHEGDGLGKLKLTTGDLKRRDRFVLQQCAQRNIPVATVIGGGYNHDHELLTTLHAIIVEEATNLYYKLPMRLTAQDWI